MKIRRLYRVLSGMLGVVLLLQPVVMAADAVAMSSGGPGGQASEQMAARLKAAKVFDSAPQAAGLYERWGAFFATLDRYLPVLERVQQAEKELCRAARQHLTGWAASLDGKTADPADAPAIQAEKQAREELLGALVKQDEYADSILKEAARVRVFLEELRTKGKLNWQILAAASKIEMKLRVQGETHDLQSSFFGVFRLLQAQVIGRYKIPEATARAALDATAAMEEKLGQLSGEFDVAQGEFLMLAQIPTAPLRSFDADKEGKILSAAAALVEQVKKELRTKADGNSRAHLEVLRRVENLLADQTASYEELTGLDLGPLPAGSFLETPSRDQVSGRWQAFAERHRAIALDLTARLKEKDVAVTALVGGLPAVSDKLGGGLDSIDFSKMGLSADDLAFVPQVKADVMTRVTAVQVLNREREAALAALRGLGKVPFENVDLTSRAEAGIYDKLGATYGLLLHQGQDLSRMASAATGLIRASKDPRAVVTAEAAAAAVAPIKQAVDTLGTLARADEQSLNLLRKLSLDMSLAHGDEAGKLSAALTAVMAGVDGKGKYEPALKAITERLASDAGVLKAFGDALSRVMPATLPEVTPEWIGACGLGRSMVRGLVRGSYMESRAVESVTRALKGGGTELADKLAVLDLALAIDFPVDLAVAPDGIQIGVGEGPEAVRIVGVGNIDAHRLAAGSGINDFTLRGAAMGGFWGNAWEGFKSTAGAVKDGVVAVGGFIKDTAIKVKDNFLSDPMKWVELGFYATVGALVLTGTIATAPAWLIPAVGVFVASEILGAVVDVAKDRKWINEAWEKTLKLGITVLGIVAGAIWEKGLKLGWEGLKTFHKDIIKNIKMLIPRLKHLPKTVWDFIRGTNLIKNIKRIKDVLDSIGAVKNVKDFVETVWTWITQGPTTTGPTTGPGGGPGSGPGTGPGGGPGTGLPHPGDGGGEAEQAPGVKLQPLR